MQNDRNQNIYYTAKMEKNIAIQVKNVSKTFRIPHEKVTSLRSAAISAFKKKSYEEFKALDDVSFDVKKGEFFGIIGRNGSGKSTLLKVLAGIYQADKGKVKINGMISPFLELGIGFNPELSGRDNVYLNATVLGMTKKQIDEKFDDIVKFSELERFIDQKLKNYSSGMQVRLAFSVSIHANRDILLMDEVLAVGDSNFQSKCLEEFNKYRDMGRTVVIVTHDIGVVQRYCDRALLLRSGRMILCDEADKVVDEYMHNNMADEEIRSVASDKLGENNERLGGQNKSVEITSVRFLDVKGNVSGVFERGDDIVARIYFVAHRKITKPVFGVAIYTQDGIAITGPNTRDSNFDIDFIEGEGFVDFKIVNNYFIQGKYIISAGIYEWNCIVPLDVRVKEYSFSIFSREKKQYGIINIEHVWNIK